MSLTQLISIWIGGFVIFFYLFARHDKKSGKKRGAYFVFFISFLWFLSFPLGLSIVGIEWWYNKIK